MTDGLPVTERGDRTSRTDRRWRQVDANERLRPSLERTQHLLATPVWLQGRPGCGARLGHFDVGVGLAAAGAVVSAAVYVFGHFGQKERGALRLEFRLELRQQRAFVLVDVIPARLIRGLQLRVSDQIPSL